MIGLRQVSVFLMSLFLFFFVSTLGVTNAAPALAATPTETEWTNKVVETRVLGAKVRTEVQRKGPDLKGVVRIRPPFSPVETYHFTGKIEGDHITAAHTSGHAFQGKMSSDKMVEGVLTTRDGLRIPLKVRMP
jgi:hypothetical protein